MKITIEVPESEMKLVKRRAKADGLQVKETIAQLLSEAIHIRLNGTAKKHPRIGKDSNLMPVKRTARKHPRIGKDPKTGFPIILGGRTPKPEEVLTAQQMKHLLEEEELERFHAVGR